MALLVIVVVVAALWFWSRKGGRSANVLKQPDVGLMIQPEIKVAVTTSTGRGPGSGVSDTIDTGRMARSGEDGWVLNPASPLPLTVVGADEGTARKLKAQLGASEHWSSKAPDIALLIAQHNLRFPEVDEFIEQLRPRFDSELKRCIAASSEWAAASDNDRQDLRAEFERSALDSLDISVGDAALDELLRGQPGIFSEDDALLAQFDGNSNLYSFYLSVLSRSGTVHIVKVDDYWRKLWEQLVGKGYARRGKDIPREMVLEGLRLKDLNELLAGRIEKPFGRKAKAIQAALAQPDLDTQLSAHLAFREMFQVLEPDGVEVETLTKSFAYANALAMVVQQTYLTGVRSLEAIAQKAKDDFYNAWEIRNWQDPVPGCAKAYCKMYTRLPAKRPPFHVGCTCELEASFREQEAE